MSAEAPRDNLRGGAWLIADMSLNIWALSIVKWLDAGFPVTQVVFMRAAVGLLIILPLIWAHRAQFRNIEHLPLQFLRVGLSVVTLTASFFAISRVPIALFTAVNFTRPIVTMVLAALVLNEAIGRRRWMAAGIALLGVIFATNPRDVSWSLGLAALMLVVLTGSAAIIVTRRLRATPSVVLMTFYTGGLLLFTAPVAACQWTQISSDLLIPLLAVGAFAQGAQVCFLKAHYYGEASFLSVLGYLSLVLSVGVGVIVFDETPSIGFALGASLVVAAALWVVIRSKTVTPS